MNQFSWPNDDGWPYPDADREPIDLASEPDDDLMLLRAAPSHLFDDLDPLERRVLDAHYGLDGVPARSMKQLHTEMGLPRSQLREILGNSLTKLRAQLLT